MGHGGEATRPPFYWLIMCLCWAAVAPRLTVALYLIS